MLEKREGEPCPKCLTPLMRRRSTFRTILGDVAFCVRCDRAYELFDDPHPAHLPALEPV